MFTYLNERIDLRLLAITVLLVIIGLASVYSAVFDAHMPNVYSKQVLWMVLGLIVMMATLGDAPAVYPVHILPGIFRLARSSPLRPLDREDGFRLDELVQSGGLPSSTRRVRQDLDNTRPGTVSFPIGYLPEEIP